MSFYRKASMPRKPLISELHQPSVKHTTTMLTVYTCQQCVPGKRRRQPLLATEVLSQ